MTIKIALKDQQTIIKLNNLIEGSWPGDDPTVSPGDGFEWHGRKPIGRDKGALAASGFGGVAAGFIDFGFDVACSAITTGMENDWQYGAEQWAEIGISAGFSLLSIGISKKFQLGFDANHVKKANAAVKNVNKNMLKNKSSKAFTKLAKDGAAAAVRKSFDFNVAEMYYCDMSLSILESLLVSMAC